MSMYQDIEERCINGLNYAKSFLYDLCKKYALEPIEVKSENFWIENLDRPARFSRDSDGKVYIAFNKIRLICNKNVIEPEIRHEFRHYWQSVYYSKLFLWWMVDHRDLYEAFQNTKDKYGRVLAYLYCPLEIDACAFEKSDKVNENILKNANYELSYWKKILDNQHLLSYGGGIHEIY